MKTSIIIGEGRGMRWGGGGETSIINFITKNKLFVSVLT
jgi:hypothetical protein